MKLTVEVHAEDGAFWAEVAELPGCFASGDTLSELFDSLRDGIEIYLAGGEPSDVRRRQILSS